MSDSIERLEHNARVATAALSRAKQRVHDAENQAVVGKCFKYRNSYSCHEKPSDYFWLYLKVVKAAGGRLETFTFQTDNRGRFEVETRSNLYHINEGYREISGKEFQSAWDKLMSRLESRFP
jgi:hypothetical protein